MLIYNDLHIQAEIVCFGLDLADSHQRTRLYLEVLNERWAKDH